MQLGEENAEQIRAEGGVVLLTASQLDKTVAGIVNNNGGVVVVVVVDASSAELKGGRVVFSGRGQVEVVNVGEIKASSESGDGGSVSLTADQSVAVAGQIEADGRVKGGRVDVSGRKATSVADARLNAVGAEAGLIRIGGEFQGVKPARPFLTTF